MPGTPQPVMGPLGGAWVSEMGRGGPIPHGMCLTAQSEMLIQSARAETGPQLPRSLAL